MDLILKSNSNNHSSVASNLYSYYTPMGSIGFLEIFLALISFIIFRCCVRSNNGLPRNWPLVGTLPDLLLNVHRVHDWFTQVLERSGGTFLVCGMANSQSLWTADPINIHYIMSANFCNFPKGSKFKRMFEILGDGIFNSDLDLWKKQRLFARALISHRRFHQFTAKAIQEKVEKGLISILEHASKHGQVVDLQDVFQRFTFDATCILVSGYDPGCLSVELPEVPFSKAMDDAEEAIFYRHVKPETVWRLEKWLQIGSEKKLKKAWITLDHILADYISRKREELKKQSVLKEEAEGFDLLTSYMKEDKPIMEIESDDKFLRDTFLNFMIAGRDTTSSALSWFFWLVSTNPQIETKIREEIQAEIPAKETKTWRLFDEAELNKLVYLHGALCETLRLYPPVPFQQKVPLKPDILPSGHNVNPDVGIFVSLYAMGRMKSIWGDDCLQLKPERWISTCGRIKHEPSYKFMAFNAGPRTCLGREIAFSQMKAVAATIIHNYNVKVVEGHKVVPGNSVILHMKHGLMVRISRRLTSTQIN